MKECDNQSKEKESQISTIENQMIEIKKNVHNMVN
jgi:hypothetical protein